MKQITRLRLGVVAAALAGTAACSSPPTSVTQDYQLSALLADQVALPCLATAGAGNARAKAESWVQVDRLLNSNAIVLQLDAVKWHQARGHHWAVPLQQQLAQSSLQREAVRDWICERQAQLVVQGFHGEQDAAVVRGYWHYVDTDGAPQLAPFYQREALREDGYPALVEALSQAWLKVLADLPSL